MPITTIECSLNPMFTPQILLKLTFISFPLPPPLTMVLQDIGCCLTNVHSLDQRSLANIHFLGNLSKVMIESKWFRRSNGNDHVFVFVNGYRPWPAWLCAGIRDSLLMDTCFAMSLHSIKLVSYSSFDTLERGTVVTPDIIQPSGLGFSPSRDSCLRARSSQHPVSIFTGAQSNLLPKLNMLDPDERSFILVQLQSSVFCVSDNLSDVFVFVVLGNGCIPVVIARQRLHLPHEAFIDWASFLITVSSSYSTSLPEELQAISEQSIHSMRVALCNQRFCSYPLPTAKCLHVLVR